MNTSQDGIDEFIDDAHHRLHGWPLVGVVVALFLTLLMAALDGTIVDTATPSLEISLDVLLIGMGLGILMPLVNVATQNVLPKNRLGVGTGAVTFLRSMGSTLSTSVLGAIVNTISQREINIHLSVSAHRFSDAYLRAATEKQVLTSRAYRQNIVQQGISNTLNATHVSPGPHHASTVASLIQQTTLLLNRLFEIVRQALSTGIHQAFIF